MRTYFLTTVAMVGFVLASLSLPLIAKGGQVTVKYIVVKIVCEIW